MVAGLAAFALASAAFVVAGQAHWLGAARLAQGCAAAAFSPAAGAALAGLGGKKRTGRLFGGYGGAKGVGYLLGPIAGGALVQVGGYGLLFVVLAVVAAIAAAAVVVALPAMAPGGRQRSTLAGLVRQIREPRFWRPVLVLAAAAGALSAGVGFLPVLGARHHLDALATGALVSLLAATAALVQPWAGRRHDTGRLPTDATTVALVVAAAGFAVAVAFPGAPGIAAAAVLIGIGVAVATPLGFAALAAAAPPDRMGRTMGAGEVGRELGDAGGPVLVGALGPIGLGAGLGALAAVLVVCAGASSGRLGRRDPTAGRVRAERQRSTVNVDHLVATYRYPAVFVLVAAESLGIPLPGETMLIAAGTYAGHTHRLSVWAVFTVAATAAIIGDNVGFWIGDKGGYRLLRRYGHYGRVDETKLKVGR